MPKPGIQPPVRWKSFNYPNLLKEEWEEEVFLFNPASGNTHVLNSLAVEILHRLSLASATLPELATSLTETYHPDNPELFRRHLQQHLAHLDGLGLIVPDSP